MIFQKSKAKDIVYVYIAAGQSNAGDAVGFSGLTPQALKNQLDVKVWYDPNFDNSGSWEYMRAGYNNQIKGTEGGKLLGPEISCAYQLSLLKPGKIHWINYTFGGTRLSISPTVDDWSPDSTNEYFDILVAHVNRGLSRLVQMGKVPIIKGFDWMQGESEASLSGMTTYYTLLVDLFDQFKAEMYTRGWDTSQMRINIGKIHNKFQNPETTRPSLTDVRQAQVDFGATYPNAHTDDNDDLAVMPDFVHWTTASQKTRGDRLAVYWSSYF